MIAKYLEWLGSLLVISDLESLNKLGALVKKIRSRRPVKKGRNQSLAEKGLTDEQVDLLFEIFRPESDLNPFEGESTKVRNRLMF